MGKVVRLPGKINNALEILDKLKKDIEEGEYDGFVFLGLKEDELPTSYYSCQLSDLPVCAATLNKWFIEDS